MDVLVLKCARQGDYVSLELECNKHRAGVLFGPNHVSVCARNASNRAWGGLGRFFPNVEAARAAYKSSAMRSMIDAAVAARDAEVIPAWTVHADIYGFRRAMSFADTASPSRAAELMAINWMDAGYCLDALDIAPAGSVYRPPVKDTPPVIRKAWIR